MPIFNFEVKVNNLPLALLKLDSASEKTLEEIGEAAAGHANDKAPVDTGALSESYDYNVPDNRHVEVGSPLEYAPYVELGTGPYYDQPPGWVQNNAQRGYHDTEPWWYMGDDGEWHLGGFVVGQPHLRPAFLSHADEYMRIYKKNLQNA